MSKQITLRRTGGLGDVCMVLCAAHALHEHGYTVNIETDIAYVDLVRACPFVSKTKIEGSQRFFNLDPISFGVSNMHQVDAYLFACGESEPDPAKKSLVLCTSEALNHHVSKKTVAIHAYVGDKNRTWPEEKWKELASRLHEADVPTVYIGSSIDETGKGSFKLGRDSYFDRTHLETVNLLRECSVLVSTDSGPIQLAGATDCSIVGIYSVVRPENRLPYREKGLSIGITPQCRYHPCYSLISDKTICEREFKPRISNGEEVAEVLGGWCPESWHYSAPLEQYPCMVEISVGQVFDAVMCALEAEQTVNTHKTEPHIRLSMIVKNEAHVIKRCLESVKPLIKSSAIVDTGSTDETMRLADEILRGDQHSVGSNPSLEYKNDFSAWRNSALSDAHDRWYQEDADWLFLIDADEILHDAQLLPPLDPNVDAYGIELRTQGGSPFTFPRANLLNAKRRWRFVNAIDEELVLEDGTEPTVVMIPPGPWIEVRQDGARSQDPMKHQKDFATRMSVFESTGNLKYLFLAANTACAFDKSESLRLMNRFLLLSANDKKMHEFRYVAALTRARLMEDMSHEPADVISSYLFTHDLDYRRAEAFGSLSWYLQKERLFEAARTFAWIAASLPEPATVCYHEKTWYAWLAADRYAALCAKCGKIEEAKMVWTDVLKHCPEEEKERIENNIKTLISQP